MQCPVGKYSGAGATACTMCEAGYFCSGNRVSSFCYFPVYTDAKYTLHAFLGSETAFNGF